MDDASRLRLLYGPYKPPRFKVSGTLRCVLRGWVKGVGISDAPIPWPVCQVQGGRPLLVCGGLVRAVQLGERGGHHALVGCEAPHHLDVGEVQLISGGIPADERHFLSGLP